MSKNYTDTQLLNIIAFCTLMQNNDGIMEKSPSYVVEKFERYASSNEVEIYWGLDLIRQVQVQLWANKWSIDLPDPPEE